MNIIYIPNDCLIFITKFFDFRTHFRFNSTCTKINQLFDYSIKFDLVIKKLTPEHSHMYCVMCVDYLIKTFDKNKINVFDKIFDIIAKNLDNHRYICIFDKILKQIIFINNPDMLEQIMLLVQKYNLNRAISYSFCYNYHVIDQLVISYDKQISDFNYQLLIKNIANIYYCNHSTKNIILSAWNKFNSPTLFYSFIRKHDKYLSSTVCDCRYHTQPIIMYIDITNELVSCLVNEIIDERTDCFHEKFAIDYITNSKLSLSNSNKFKLEIIKKSMLTNCPTKEIVNKLKKNINDKTMPFKLNLFQKSKFKKYFSI